MNVKEIKKLPFVLHYEGEVKLWTGRTNDTMQEIIAKGYCEVYPAHSSGDSYVSTYKKCSASFIPLHRIVALK